MKNLYQILGVDINANNQEIKTAYRKLATKFHPDKNFGDQYFEERFKEIQLAYKILNNEQSRLEYNKKLFDFYRKAANTNTNTNTNTSPKYQRSNTQRTSYKNPTPTTSKSPNGCLLFIGFGFSIFIIIKVLGLITDRNHYENPIGNITDSVAATVDSPDTPLYIDTARTAIDSVSATPIIISNTEPKRPLTYNSLMNGDSPLKECFGSGKFQGRAFITFKNSNETDAVICLVASYSGITIRNEYIRAGSDYTMREIPSGIYYLKVYYGNDWNSQKINFCGYSGGFNFDESFSKSDKIGDLITIEDNENNYTTGTITLYKVENGNMQSEQINAQEFFK